MVKKGATIFNNEQIISITICLCSIFVCGLLSFFFPSIISYKESVVVGILSYVVSIVTFWNKHFSLMQNIPLIMSRLNIIDSRIINENSILSNYIDPIDIFWSISISKASSGIYELINPTTIKITREQFPNFWNHAILNASSSWFCTNFSNSEDDLYSSWAKRGFEFQSMASKINNVSVKRLYISKNQSRLSPVYFEHMKWQAVLGFSVRHIFKTNRMKWAFFKEMEELIGTVDIAIIDNKYLLAFHLSDKEKREIEYIIAYSDIDIVTKVNSLFNHMWDSAITVDSMTF